MPCILVIEDDDEIRKMIGETLRRNAHEVIEASNGKLALDLTKRHAVDVVITDLIMPEKEGLETIMELRREAPAIGIIAISGGYRVNPATHLAMAKKLGARRTLSKPFLVEDLLAAVTEVMNEGRE